jgi:hypothetical protein
VPLVLVERVVRRDRRAAERAADVVGLGELDVGARLEGRDGRERRAPRFERIERFLDLQRYELARLRNALREQSAARRDLRRDLRFLADAHEQLARHELRAHFTRERRLRVETKRDTLGLGVRDARERPHERRRLRLELDPAFAIRDQHEPLQRRRFDPRLATLRRDARERVAFRVEHDQPDVRTHDELERLRARKFRACSRRSRQRQPVADEERAERTLETRRLDRTCRELERVRTVVAVHDHVDRPAREETHLACGLSDGERNRILVSDARATLRDDTRRDLDPFLRAQAQQVAPADELSLQPPSLRARQREPLARFTERRRVRHARERHRFRHKKQRARERGRLVASAAAATAAAGGKSQDRGEKGESESCAHENSSAAHRSVPARGGGG